MLLYVDLPNTGYSKAFSKAQAVVKHPLELAAVLSLR